MEQSRTTVGLDKEQRDKIVGVAYGLGYTEWHRGKRRGNMSGLLRAIADGEVCVVEWSVLEQMAQRTNGQVVMLPGLEIEGSDEELERIERVLDKVPGRDRNEKIVRVMMSGIRVAEKEERYG